MHPTVVREILEDHNPWWFHPESRRSVPGVRRDLYERLQAFAEFDGGRRAALVVGPRRVGKTTLLLQLANELLSKGWPPGNLTYFDFSDDRLTEQISGRAVVDVVPAGCVSERQRAFLLDEISKSVRWAPWLKQAVDNNTARNLFVATDSAASMLHRGAAESGQGRWDKYEIEGLSFAEFLRLFGPEHSALENFRRIPDSVDRFLEVGGFPEHATAEAEDYYRVRERIREDIAERAIVWDLLRLDVDVQRVKKLFVYLMEDSGAIFTASARARDLGADPRSVAQWLQALHDTYLVRSLNAQSERATKRLRSPSKVYASDHGLVTAFAPSGSLVRDQNARSRAVEAMVFRHLRDVQHLVHGELTFFRTRDNRSSRNDDLEADFVLSYDDGAVVIEVTSSPHPSSRKFNRLHRVGEVLKTSRLVMIHGGTVDSTEDQVNSLSLARFLLAPQSVLETRK
jgi:predicted AAA+ superfamily ATPase